MLISENVFEEKLAQTSLFDRDSNRSILGVGTLHLTLFTVFSHASL